MKYLLIALLLSSCSLFKPPLCGNFVAVPYKDITICVSSDYYMTNGIRTPLTVPEVQNVIGNEFVLPTKNMVDAIWLAADLKLNPKPMNPNASMTSFKIAVDHNNIINKSINNRSYKLIAGIKKDIIRSESPDKVTIYGWHTLQGTPIQPVSSVHSYLYKDYSHGLRLVQRYGYDRFNRKVDLINGY